MKSYIINIELIGTNPLVWRKVIMPAGATFNRLHNILQDVTNFQSGQGRDYYHLFEFEFEDIIITNDEQGIWDHKDYKENPEYYEERLRDVPKELLRFETIFQEKIKTKHGYPKRIKIDKYLEKFKEISYLYDFGDGWEFKIKLEDIVHDYDFGYPTLLDGAETAPPEDVGGIYGFENFLEIYNDKNHPENKEVKKWADFQGFREYDPKWINYILKDIKYMKTDWDKINHINYKIIENKYRKE